MNSGIPTPLPEASRGSTSIKGYGYDLGWCLIFFEGLEVLPQDKVWRCSFPSLVQYTFLSTAILFLIWVGTPAPW